MIRNAQYVLEYIIDDNELAKPAQVGVDLTLGSVSRISPDPAMSFAGRVFNDATAKRSNVKADFASYEIVAPTIVDHYNEEVYLYALEPGVYSIEFDQGLKPLKENDTAFIVQRSTLGRNGAMIRSSVYDPGFETPKMGAVLYVFVPIQIERHARVAQILIHENEEAELYDGSYQGANDFR